MIIEHIKQDTTEVTFTLGENTLNLFSLLTSKLYSDPIHSFMRELISNAIDACVENDLPVRYSAMVQNGAFIVRDYGSGLHKEELKDFYTQLGSSTKTHTNELIGGMGIGRLSPLSHAEEFTVDSYYEGFVTNLTVAKPTGVPIMRINHYTQTTEPNGLRVTVKLHPELVKYAQKTLQDIVYFLKYKPENVIPKKNTYCPEFDLNKPVTLLTYDRHISDDLTCAIRSTSPFVQVWIDGFIYQTQIHSELAKGSVLQTRLSPLKYTYTVKMRLDEKGVKLTPNREALQNNPELQQRVVAKLNQYIDEETNLFLNTLAQTTYLDTKVKLIRFFLYRRELNTPQAERARHPVITAVDQQVAALNNLMPFDYLEISSSGRIASKPITEPSNHMTDLITLYLQVPKSVIVNDSDKPIHKYDSAYLATKDEDSVFHGTKSTKFLFPREHKETLQKLIDPENLVLLSQIPLKQPTPKSSNQAKTGFKKIVYYEATNSYNYEGQIGSEPQPLLTPHTTPYSFYIFTEKDIPVKSELITRQLINTQAAGLIGDFTLNITAPSHKKRLKEPFLEITYEPDSIKQHLPLLKTYAGFNIIGAIQEKYYKELLEKPISEELKILLNSLLNNNTKLKIHTEETPDIGISDIALLFKKELNTTEHTQTDLTINLAEEMIRYRLHLKSR